MTDERAKEIAEMLRQAADVGAAAELDPSQALGFLLKLYDDIQRLKKATAFMTGITSE